MELRDILPIITTSVITVGGIIGLVQVRHARRQRARESALHLVASFRTPEFLKAIDLVFILPDGLTKKEIDERLKDITPLLVLFGTFESLGILVYRRDIEIDMVEDFFSGVIVLSGRKLKRYVEEMREAGDRQTYYEWFTWLTELVERRELKKPAVPAFIAHRGWKD